MWCPQCCGSFCCCSLIIFGAVFSISVWLLDTLDACVLHSSCVAAAARLLSALSVHMEVDLIIIDKYDNVIFLYPVERMRKPEGEREGAREKKWKKESAQDSTDRDIKVWIVVVDHVYTKCTFWYLFCVAISLILKWLLVWRIKWMWL